MHVHTYLHLCARTHKLLLLQRRVACQSYLAHIHTYAINWCLINSTKAYTHTHTPSPNVPRDETRSTRARGASRVDRTRANRGSASALRAANQRKRCAAAYKPVELLLLLRFFSPPLSPSARHRITALTRAELHPPRRPDP